MSKDDVFSEENWADWSDDMKLLLHELYELAERCSSLEQKYYQMRLAEVNANMDPVLGREAREYRENLIDPLVRQMSDIRMRLFSLAVDKDKFADVQDELKSGLRTLAFSASAQIPVLINDKRLQKGSMEERLDVIKRQFGPTLHTAKELLAGSLASSVNLPLLYRALESNTQTVEGVRKIFRLS